MNARPDARAFEATLARREVLSAHLVRLVLTGLDGFPTDSYLSWIVPLSCLQGAGFAGAATGANLARDIEQGWFDRLLVAPVPRPMQLASIVASASLRALLPIASTLVVAFR